MQQLTLNETYPCKLRKQSTVASLLFQFFNFLCSVVNWWRYFLNEKWKIFSFMCNFFVDRCLSFCPFSFGHCVVFPSSIYVFWLPLWYLQTLQQFIRIIVSHREIPVISEIGPTFVTAGYNPSKRGVRWLYLDELNILLRRQMRSSWISLHVHATCSNS